MLLVSLHQDSISAIPIRVGYCCPTDSRIVCRENQSENHAWRTRMSDPHPARLSRRSVICVVVSTRRLRDDGRRSDTRGIPASLAGLEVFMSTPLSLLAVRRCVVLGLLCLLTTPVLADSITIGSITFLSQGTWGDPHKAFVLLHLDTTGMTFDEHFQGMAYSLLVRYSRIRLGCRNVHHPSTHVRVARSTLLLSLRVGGLHHVAAGSLAIPVGERAAVYPRDKLHDHDGAVARTNLPATGTDGCDRADVRADTGSRTCVVAVGGQWSAGRGRSRVEEEASGAPDS